jgi:hypothetical protein
VLIMTMPARGWIDQPTNRMYVEDLRSKLAQEDGGLIVFFGAGVSFGATRSRGRFDFESHNHGGDTEPFPSWEALVARMLATLKALPDLHEREAELDSFFREQNALDCAQLFKQQVGDADFFDFLRLQYTGARAGRTPSHSAITALPVRELFTTNFDTLLEQAFLERSLAITVSVGPEQFLSRLGTQLQRHLVKLHGTIDHPATIVLTRSQYAASRKGRVEMFNHLRLRQSSFLFVGYSLRDPNFTLLHDEARLALGATMPASYLVQGVANPVREAYLRSLDVNVITLGSWDWLPNFLTAINPDRELSL